MFLNGLKLEHSTLHTEGGDKSGGIFFNYLISFQMTCEWFNLSTIINFYITEFQEPRNNLILILGALRELGAMKEIQRRIM